MTDYHTVYKGPEGESTQWDDIQRKLGNLPPKAAAWKPDAYTPEQDEVHGTAWLEARDAEELEEAEDEFSDDRFLELYRQKRVKELQHAVGRPRFGTVEHIRAAEFVQKVTEASKMGQQQQQHATSLAANAQEEDAARQGVGDAVSAQQMPEVAGAAVRGEEEGAPEGVQGKGLWVVVQLYKDGLGRSALMSKCIDELAERYPHTKFVRIVATDCIPKYPDANVPTLLVYHAGRCVKHLVGLDLFGGARATPEQVALVLNQLGPVCSSSMEGEEEDGAEQEREQQHLVRQLVKRVVLAQEEGDESSDFDD